MKPITQTKPKKMSNPNIIKHETPATYQPPAEVVKEGKQIIIPEGMSYKEAIDWIQKQEAAEETPVAVHAEIECFPLDGVLALARAMKQVYGFAQVKPRDGFWGPVPPVIVDVPVSATQTEMAVIGKLCPPAWEGGYLTVQISNVKPILNIQGNIKRKHEAGVKGLIALTRELLKTSSIYKGQAVSVDLSYMTQEARDNERGFDPIDDAPKFMDLDGITEDSLILNDVTQFELRANIYTLIEQTEACQQNRIPLKHGALFMGSYGTGKTLTARVMAHKCVANGWTFIYLKNANHLSNALRVAELYAPAVLFAEDIDQAMTGERDEELNEILNTIDGVDTKGKAIVTILTTNHPEKINPAFLRAGRIDTVIHMQAPDAKTAVRFVHVFAKDDEGRALLADQQDLTQAGTELAGFVPAFIAEAVQKAKRFAIHREGANITGKLLGDDLVLAAKALKKHAAMVERKDDQTPEQQFAAGQVEAFRYLFRQRNKE
jgi:hypothetical protein